MIDRWTIWVDNENVSSSGLPFAWSLTSVLTFENDFSMVDSPLEFDRVDIIQDLNQAIHPLFIVLTILSTSQDEGTDVREVDCIS